MGKREKKLLELTNFQQGGKIYLGRQADRHIFLFENN